MKKIREARPDPKKKPQRAAPSSARGKPDYVAFPAPNRADSRSPVRIGYGWREKGRNELRIAFNRTPSRRVLLEPVGKWRLPPLTRPAGGQSPHYLAVLPRKMPVSGAYQRVGVAWRQYGGKVYVMFNTLGAHRVVVLRPRVRARA